MGAEVVRKPTVGILGYGAIGRAITTKLLSGGFDVQVWNRTPNKAHPELLRSKLPMSLVLSSDVNLLCVSDRQAVEEVLEQVLSGGHRFEKTALLQLSTLHPEATAAWAARCHAQGIDFLDAPILGGPSAVVNQQIITLLAGSELAFRARASTVVSAYTGQLFYCGETPGRASSMKLVFNALLGGMLTAYAESFALAKALGEENLFLRVLERHPGLRCGMFEAKRERLLHPEVDSAEFSVNNLEKDLRYALQLAAEKDVPVAVLRNVHSAFLAAKTAGNGKADVISYRKGFPK